MRRPKQDTLMIENMVSEITMQSLMEIIIYKEMVVGGGGKGRKKSEGCGRGSKWSHGENRVLWECYVRSIVGGR